MRHWLHVLFPRPLNPDDLFQVGSDRFLRGEVRAPVGSWEWLDPVYFAPYLEQLENELMARGRVVERNRKGAPPYYSLHPDGVLPPFGVILPEPPPMTLARLVRLMSEHLTPEREDAFFRLLEIAKQDLSPEFVDSLVEGTTLESVMR